MAKLAHTKHPLSFPLCRVPLPTLPMTGRQDPARPCEAKQQARSRRLARACARGTSPDRSIFRISSYRHTWEKKTQSTEDTLDRAQYFAAVAAGDASRLQEMLATPPEWANAHKVCWWLRG